jgi:L-iditol 2-dehydrogenase
VISKGHELSSGIKSYIIGRRCSSEADEEEKLKAAVLARAGVIEIRNVSDPGFKNEGEVLLRTKRAGLCGSDFHYFRSDLVGGEIIQHPAILGHECSAAVEEAGKDATRVKRGGRVAVDPAISCGVCDQCRAGRHHTCRNLRFLGYPGQMDGCLAEYLVMPGRNVYALPDGMTWEEGALVEPLSIALYALERGRDEDKNSAGILGSGPLGLCLALAARDAGISRIYTTDRVTERVVAARKAGADWSGNPDDEDIVHEILEREPYGLDRVFECSGDPAALDQAVELLKPGGRLFILGIPIEPRAAFDMGLLRRKEIAIQNIRRQNRCTEKAIEAIASRRIDVAWLATHILPLAEGQRAFETASGYKFGVLKAMIAFE